MDRFILFILSEMGYLFALYMFNRGRRSAFYPSILVSFISLMGFAGGLLGQMRVVYSAIFCAGLLLLPICSVCALLCRKKPCKLTFSAVFPLICFVLGTAVLAIALNGHFLYDYDDFTHWGRVAEIISNQQRLPIQSDMLSHASYPPGSALFIAYGSSVLGSAVDIYQFSQAHMLLAFFISVFAATKKIWGQMIIATIVMRMMQYNIALDALSVDNLLGAASVAAVMMCISDRKYSYKMLPGLALILGTLVLIKNSGVFIGAMILIYAVLINIRGGKKAYFRMLFLLIPIVVFIAWKWYCGFAFEDVGKHALSWEYYGKNLEEKQGTGFHGLLMAIVPLLINPAKNHALYLIPGFIILACMMASDKKCKGILGFTALLFVAYELGVLLMYFFSMPAEELISGKRTDYLRYNGTIVVVMAAIQVYLSFVLLRKYKRKGMLIRVVAAIVGCLIVCTAGYSLSLKHWPIHSVENRLEKNPTVAQLMEISKDGAPLSQDDTVVVLYSEKAASDYHKLVSSYYLGTSNVLCCYDEEAVEAERAKIPWSYYINLPKGEVEEPRETVGVELFTNTSTMDFINVLDTAGYKENTRYSRWNSGDIDAANWDTTGFIPVALGDRVCLEGVIWYPTEENEGHGAIYWFETEDTFMDKVEAVSEEALSGWNPVYDDAGNVTEITVPKHINAKASYLRLTCQDIGMSSVITVHKKTDS